MYQNAANANLLPWQQGVYQLMDHEQPDLLPPTLYHALLEHAIEIMKPDNEALKAISSETPAAHKFLLQYTRAYKTGLPPYSHVIETKQ